MDLSRRSNVLLVKAAATAWDKAGRLQGAADLPALEGEVEAVRAALDQPDARHRSLHQVFHGPDEASRQTAAAIASLAGCKPRLIPALIDMNLGLWEGVLSHDLGERCPRVFKQWRENPTVVSPPEGESFAEVSHRVTSSICRMVSRLRGETDVCFVLRPIAFAAAACWLRDWPTSRAWEVIASPERVMLCEVVPSTLQPEPAPAAA